MVKKISLKADKRKVLGRKIKVLRREGILPANIFGKDFKSEAIQLKLADFKKVYAESGETTLLELEVAGEKALAVLIHNLAVHPVSGDFLHVDFHKVSLADKVTAKVPVELVGKAPAAESGLGVLITLLSELEVEALPTELPEKLIVEVAKLEKVDDAVRVKDIKIDKEKVKILAEENQIVVKIEKPTVEEVVAKPAEEAVPAEGGEAKSEEGKAEEKAEVKKETPKEEAEKEKGKK